MKRSSDYCKEFGNGNINIKLDQDLINEFKKDSLLVLSDILSSIDCCFFGESFCLSNYEMGHMIYNLYSDVAYIFPWRYLDELSKGKTVKLYARKVDDYDRETLRKEGYNV